MTAATTTAAIAPVRPIESPSTPTAESAVGPVRHRVERPVERLVEAHVEELHQGQQPENAAHHHREYPPRACRQHEDEGNDAQPFDGQPQECHRGQFAGSGSGRPGRTTPTGRPATVTSARHAAVRMAARACASARCAMVRTAATVTSATRRWSSRDGPQPPHVAAERLGQQRQRDRQRGRGQPTGQDIRRHDRQHDALGRRDDLAPVPRWQRPRSHGCSQPAATKT